MIVNIVNKNDIIKLKPPGTYYRVLEIGQDAIKGRFAKLEEVRETAAGYEDVPGHGMTVLTEKIAKNISVIDRLPEPVPDLRDFSVQDGELLYKRENLWESDARTVTSVIAAVSGGAIVSVKDGDTETLSMFDIEKMETTDIHKGGKKYKKLLQKEQSLLVLCTAGNGGRYPLLFEGDFLCWKGKDRKVFGRIVDMKTLSGRNGKSAAVMIFAAPFANGTKILVTRLLIRWPGAGRLPKMEIESVAFKGILKRVCRLPKDDGYGYVFVTDRGIVYSPFRSGIVREVEGEEILRAVRKFPMPVRASVLGDDMTEIILGGCHTICRVAAVGKTVTVEEDFRQFAPQVKGGQA